MSIETKDYWTIIALEACGHLPLDIQAAEPKDGRSCIVTYFFPDEVSEDFDAWMRGAIGPVPKEGEEQSNLFETIRRVQQSHTKFKNNLHRYSR
jgi:hypothetical protein